MTHEQIVHPEMPGRTFVVRKSEPKAVFEVFDLTNLSEAELMQWKRSNVNYATTEAAGRYYALMLVDMVEVIEETPGFGAFLAKMYLEAADWWNDKAIAAMN